MRTITIKIYDMINDGILGPNDVVRECLSYMSEDDVADMAHAAGWLDTEDEGDNVCAMCGDHRPCDCPDEDDND